MRKEETLKQTLTESALPSVNISAFFGPQYASAILYHNASQRELAERSVADQQRLRAQQPNKTAVLTKVLPANVFHEAERCVMVRLFKWLCATKSDVCLEPT